MACSCNPCTRRQRDVGPWGSLAIQLYQIGKPQANQHPYCTKQGSWHLNDNIQSWYLALTCTWSNQHSCIYMSMHIYDTYELKNNYVGCMVWILEFLSFKMTKNKKRNSRGGLYGCSWYQKMLMSRIWAFTRLTELQKGPVLSAKTNLHTYGWQTFSVEHFIVWI